MDNLTSHTQPDHKSVLAVVGGGRWGRVNVSVLAQMIIPFERVVVVSQHASTIITRFLEDQNQISKTPLSLVSTIDDLLRKYKVSAAIVVNSAQQHYDTSLRLIENKIDLLIEKPVVLESSHAHNLLVKAMATSVCLVPGLQYRFCSYLHCFAKKIHQFSIDSSYFTVEWADKTDEIRYNEVKYYDARINVADDVMPHIWTLLLILFPHKSYKIDSCEKGSNNLFAGFSLSTISGDQKGQIILRRDAHERRRIIKVYLKTGDVFVIDFTVEPGRIFLNGKSLAEDPIWVSGPRPIEQQLTYFMSVIGQGHITPSDQSAFLNSVSFSENASLLIKRNKG